MRKAVRYWCGLTSSIASAAKVCSRSDPERGYVGASVEEVPWLLECAESLGRVPRGPPRPVLGNCTLISASFFPSTRRVGSARDDALLESIVATLRSGPIYRASRLATQQLAKTVPLEYFDSCCRRWL